MLLTPDRAQTLFRRFQDLKIAVVGDLMLDRYVQGQVDRISPEAPVPVLRVLRERSVPGGACNVALNLKTLGAEARVCGIVGTCAHGDELIDQLRRAGVDVAAVHRQPEMTTIVKTRIIADRQQMLRVDREQPDIQPLAESAAFIDCARRAMQGVQGAVLEDYGKGVLVQNVVTAVLQAARSAGIPCGYDPKDNHELDVRGVTFATPNRKEAFTVAGIRDRTPEAPPLADTALQSAAARLRDLWAPEHLMITLGPQGMLLLSGGDPPEHVSTRAREVFDVSGAGDTVIATATLALSAGASFREAAELANAAAGIVVGKLGTATTTSEEILATLEARA